MSQKVDFFKVQDIDTPTQPRKKKHQNNVSSVLKTFWDHMRRFIYNHKKWDFEHLKARVHSLPRIDSSLCFSFYAQYNTSFFCENHRFSEFFKYSNLK